MTSPAPDRNAATREERLQARLTARLAPEHLSITNESLFHAGHAAAGDGHSHYRVRIVSEAFRGLAPLARHRLVYGAVGDMMDAEIHALAIEAVLPG